MPLRRKFADEGNELAFAAAGARSCTGTGEDLGREQSMWFLELVSSPVIDFAWATCECELDTLAGVPPACSSAYRMSTGLNLVELRACCKSFVTLCT